MNSLIDFIDETEFDNLKLKIEEKVSSDKSLKLSVISVISDLDLVRILEETRIGKFKISIESAKDYWKIQVRRLIVRSDIENGKRTISGEVFVEKPRDGGKIWHLITTEGLDFQKNCLERVIDLLSPKISRFYLASDELRSIFTRFENSGYTILVKKAVLYSHKEEGEISFKKLPYYLIFNEAEERDMYVDKVEFVTMKDHKFKFHGFVARGGTSKFIRGRISLYYEEFLPLLARFGEDKRRKLDRKGKNTKTFDLNPLALVFKEEVILDEGDIKRIVESLQKLPRSSILLYHSNPYLHLSLLDFIDGSSCDIFVSSPDKISIIPSHNSSLSSLMRVLNHLSKYFEEGEIVEKRRREV